MIIYNSVVRQPIKQENAAVAQSVERRIGSAEVTGPIPVSSLLKSLIYRDFSFLCCISCCIFLK